MNKFHLFCKKKSLTTKRLKQIALTKILIDPTKNLHVKLNSQHREFILETKLSPAILMIDI